MICSECNTKNGKSDKFCRNCGMKLTGTSNDNKMEGILKKGIEHIKGMFVKPVDTCKDFIKEENYMTGLIYLGINILVLAMLILLLLNQFSETFMDAMVFNSFSILPREEMQLPYFRIFLISVMTGVIIYGLIAGITNLLCKLIFNSKTSFKLMCSWLGINSLLYTVSLVVITIGFLISMKLGLLLCFIAEIICIFNIFRTLEFATDTDKNKLGYVLASTIFITILVVFTILPILF